MRIIKEKTLIQYCRLGKYKSAEKSLKAWIYEIRYNSWSSPDDLKSKYRNASIISSKRVVLNIKGNDFRLVVDIEYKLKVFFIVWFGTHNEYNSLDIKNISYED